MDIKRIKTLDIDDLVNLIVSNHYDKAPFITAINQSDISENDKTTMLTKIDVAYKRFEDPLEVSLKIFYLFFPFGIVNGLSKSQDLNLKRFQKYKYLKKIKQYHIFSALGILMYLFIVITISSFLR